VHNIRARFEKSKYIQLLQIVTLDQLDGALTRYLNLTEQEANAVHPNKVVYFLNCLAHLLVYLLARRMMTGRNETFACLVFCVVPCLCPCLCPCFVVPSCF
jgi:hypothetical protein